MKRILFLLFSLFLFSNSAFALGQCLTSQTLSCDHYDKCIEANCNCSSTKSNYPIAFGLKNCNKFISSSDFTPAGVAWRDKTLKCLSNSMTEAYLGNSGSNGASCNCEKIQKLAIESHTACYTSSPSMCDLPDQDIKVIANIVDVSDLVALGPKGLLETVKTLFVCVTDVGIRRSVDIFAVYSKATILKYADQGLKMVQVIFVELIDHANKSLPRATAKKFISELEKAYKKIVPNLCTRQKNQPPLNA